jgi:hypothetical protein
MITIDRINANIKRILIDNNIDIFSVIKNNHIDIELPENVETYDIDRIVNIDESNNIKDKECSGIKPNYSAVFEKKININDGIYAFSFLQKHDKLYNKAGVELGCVIDMYDNKNIMPKTFKNINNCVLHPIDSSILKKYVIYPGFQCYHQIQPKKYKLYKYDFDLNSLIPTNIVSIDTI